VATEGSRETGSVDLLLFDLPLPFNLSHKALAQPKYMHIRSLSNLSVFGG
jgi:hypothetical protein